MEPADEKKTYRRRQFMIEKKFQNRFIWRFIGIIIASIFCSHLVTLGYLKVKEWISPSSQDLMYFSGAIRETLAFSRAIEILWFPLLLSALLGSILIVVFAVLYSHRIAGPLFNLKRMMKLVEEGNLKVTMRIRKTDEFHDVEEAFNSMLKGLNSNISKLETAVAKLPNPSRKAVAEALRTLGWLDTEE